MHTQLHIIAASDPQRTFSRVKPERYVYSFSRELECVWHMIVVISKINNQRDRSVALGSSNRRRKSHCTPKQQEAFAEKS